MSKKHFKVKHGLTIQPIATPVLDQDGDIAVNSSTNKIDYRVNSTDYSISGTNSGDVTLGAVGATPAAAGASLSGQVLTLQPASDTHPGVVTTGAQTIAGVKTFTSDVTLSPASGTIGYIVTPDIASGTDGDSIQLETGAVSGTATGDSGGITLVTGANDADGYSGEIVSSTGAITANNTGNYIESGANTISTGPVVGEGNGSGPIAIETGAASGSTEQYSGEIQIKTGIVSGATSHYGSGPITIETGAVGNTEIGGFYSGDIDIRTGTRTDAGRTGNITVSPGNNPTGNAGIIRLDGVTNFSASGGTVLAVAGSNQTITLVNSFVVLSMGAAASVSEIVVNGASDIGSVVFLANPTAYNLTLNHYVGGSDNFVSSTGANVVVGPNCGIFIGQNGSNQWSQVANPSGPINLAAASASVTGTLPAANGGTGQSTYTTGDLLYASGASTLSKLGVGSGTQVLGVSGGVPAWVSAASASVNQSNLLENLGISASVAANAMTIELKIADGTTDASAGSPVRIGFRSSTLTSGAYNIRSVTGSLSTVISSGSTGGSISAIPSTVYVYAIDNAGTVELAWSLYRFVDEGVLYTTTAEGGAGAADSEAVLYSTTARTNVPIRLIGKIISTQATAGTWASSPTSVSVAPFSIPGPLGYIRIHTANGHGSSNTHIRKWSTTVEARGTSITYASSGTNGDTWTINEPGVFAISYTDGSTTTGVRAGISLNSSQLTTSIDSITAADALVYTGTSGANEIMMISWTGPLKAGDVIRCHTQSTASLTTQARFTITQLSRL